MLAATVQDLVVQYVQPVLQRIDQLEAATDDTTSADLHRQATRIVARIDNGLPIFDESSKENA